jgi:ABC-2 type transport system ATP-binding protein
MMTAPSPGHGIDPVGTATQAWWGTEDACVRYGDRLALDHVTFCTVPGRVSAVVGGDGAGRTTLLRCLAGALAVSSGRVRLPPPLRIGYLSAGSGTYPDLSVDENLAFRASAYRLPADVARERGAELLERAGLADARDRWAGQLSGGMRQKLGVIAAMLHQPDLLVLDEPTTGIDPVSRADLWWLIARAAADGAAVVLATSYLDEAERAVEVLALDAGRVLATGTPQEIIAAMPGTLRVSDARPDGEDRRRSWRRGGRWRIWDPPGQPSPHITDLRHQNQDEADVIMTQIREKSGVLPERERSDGDTAGSAGRAGSAVAPDLQDAVTVAILARELAAAGPASGHLEGGGPR